MKAMKLLFPPLNGGGIIIQHFAYRQQQIRTMPQRNAIYHRSKHGETFTSHIEVERKFVPSAALKKYLLLVHPGETLRGDIWIRKLYQAKAQGLTQDLTKHSDEAMPRFKRLPDSVFSDEYFDSNDILSNAGFWIRRRKFHIPRKRGTVWETKVRIGGDRINSQFHEVKGPAYVRAVLAKYLPWESIDTVPCIAHLRTRRTAWTNFVGGASSSSKEVELPEEEDLGPFIMVLDESDAVGLANKTNPFKHVVGEIELTRDVNEGTTVEEHDEARRRAAEQMDEQIDAFMAAYGEHFITDPKPRGKLSAYFAWRESLRNS